MMMIVIIVTFLRTSTVAFRLFRVLPKLLFHLYTHTHPPAIIYVCVIFVCLIFGINLRAADLTVATVNVV